MRIRWARWRPRGRVMSLRTRLVILLMLVLGLGLAASGVVVNAATGSFLVGRVNAQLEELRPMADRLLGDAPRIDRPAVPGAEARPNGPGAGGVLGARITATGSVVRELRPPFAATASPFDDVPAEVLARARSGQVLFTLSSGGERYQSLAMPLRGTDDVAVLALPRSGIDNTLRGLAAIEALVGLVVLVVGGALSFLLVRVSLAPLRRMAADADAVAAGDRDRRVTTQGGPEIARLGSAVNAAFDARAESEDRLRSFVSDASHELRTPITSIRGYAELLGSGAAADPEASGRAVGRIESEATRMGRIVENLLALARADEGVPLRRTDLELTVLAAEAVADARAADPGREVGLRADDAVPVRADEGAVRQVLANLLANVRAHTPAGTPCEVRVRRSGDWAVIDVVDAGPGIPAEQRGRVFDRFWRGDASHRRTSGHESSGLGLSIVAALVRAHGGTVQALDPVPGWRGAHIAVRLPA